MLSKLPCSFSSEPIGEFSLVSFLIVKTLSQSIIILIHSIAEIANPFHLTTFSSSCGFRFRFCRVHRVSRIYNEIGKEFLSSWKSMSMADDDAMDFSFDTVSKGKKKTFDFDKLDVDFNLDGEFDKISSSFKLDMSDLDFACPPKKNFQSKDKKGEVSGAKSGKQDGFNFNFDFNDLDSFNLDSSFMKIDTTSSSNSRRKVVSTEESDKEGTKVPKTNDDEGALASKDSTAVISHASERLETLNVVETMVGSPGNLVSKQDSSISKISSSGNLEMPMKNQTLDIIKSKSTEEIDQEKDLPEKAKLTESKSEQVINMACSQSLAQSDSQQHTVSDQHTEVLSSGTRVSKASGDKQEVNDTKTYQCTKMFSSGTRELSVSVDIQEVNNKASNVKSDSVDLQLDHSSPRQITQSDSSVGEAITLDSGTQEGVTNDPPPEKRYTSCENINEFDVLKKISCDNDNSENKKTTSVCHLAPSSSKPVVEKMTPTKDKLQDMQSNMLSMPEDKRSLRQPSSTVGTKGISLGNKKNADTHLGSITQARSNNTRLGSKLVRESLTDSSKLIRDAASLLGSKEDPKSSGNTREGIVSEVTPCSGKLAGNKQSFSEEMNKSKTTFLESGMSPNDVCLLSFQVNPSCLTEKTDKITPHLSVNSQPEASGKESSQKSRITSIEGNKLSSYKNCKTTPALSSLKTSRNFGANRVPTTFLQQKETNSLVSSGQTMEILGITASKSDHLIDSGDNQTPLAPFSKRKTIEPYPQIPSILSSDSVVSYIGTSGQVTTILNCRNSKESSEVVREVESMPNNLRYNHSTSGLISPPGIKVTEVEIADSVLMEDNSNVEKAEAYMKELEDICNMLKKKHEEAKELLIRAIVNDNYLLMLNHPIYEEEISFHSSFVHFSLPSHLIVDINAGYFLDVCELSEGSEICLPVDV
ncbi:hypothetical protein VNO78_11893 [Psophocarpus tetragonolobus]|uniref:Uncharacterized protein n=1 Tax=Psophocarpus tetragonolobus TaxID=3891 RepID=A0AAN9SUN2_PSOTE